MVQPPPPQIPSNTQSQMNQSTTPHSSTSSQSQQQNQQSQQQTQEQNYYQSSTDSQISDPQLGSPLGEYFSLISLKTLFTDQFSQLSVTTQVQHQQNGYSTTINNSQVQTQTFSQPCVGPQATWTGSNTLIYTQSMQPPDPRTINAPYCK